jgi:serine/threonine protein kinase
MHTDLDIKNWIVKKDGDLVLCDFGSAKILEENEVIPIGTKGFYKEEISAPEMELVNKKTKHEFSFAGDVW